MSGELHTEKSLSRDPGCNMEVPGDSEYHYHYADEHFLFCSQHCLRKFKEHPERYSEKKTPAPPETASESTAYTCPMHPEIQQQGPGRCPKCGMALEATGVPAVDSKTEYTCPMHPEIIQAHPGSCPKCGMALEPVRAKVEEKSEELVDMSRRF